MIEIKKLEQFTFKQLQIFGEQSYSSENKYDVIKEIKNDEISFLLKPVKLENNFVKNWAVNMSIYVGYLMLISKGNSFGAYENDKLTGFIITDRRSWNNSLWIEMIQVKEDHRNKGTGTLLLNAAEELAKQNKIRLIELETQNTNVPAINFYRKCEYEISGLNINLYDPSEIKDEIAIYMSKIIEF